MFGVLRKEDDQGEAEVGERAGAMVGWAGGVWKTATSHRHRSGQERPSQTDRKNPTVCTLNITEHWLTKQTTQIHSSLTLKVDILTAT